MPLPLMMAMVAGGGGTSTLVQDHPLAVAPAANSTATVVPLRSHLTLAGNTWLNGTTVQLFGMAMHTVIADNYVEDFDAVSAWGRSYQVRAL